MIDRYLSAAAIASVARYAAEFRVPVAWVYAVIMTESSGRDNAYRAEPQIGDASYGLMQLLLRTARGLGYEGPPAGLFDVETNVRLGTTLLGQLRARHGDDFDRVYSAYNSGSPTRYLTNAQVATHVSRAREWLQRVSAGGDDGRGAPASGGGGLVAPEKEVKPCPRS